MRMLKKFLRNESGATAIEYGLIAALVSVVIIAGLNVLGPALHNTYTNVGNQLNAANAG
jgi:pilus assembly protein Flp/PilA